MIWIARVSFTAFAACAALSSAPLAAEHPMRLAQSATDERQQQFQREQATRDMDEQMRRMREQRQIDDRRELERRQLQRDLDRREQERREQDRRR